jgi:hypothetical protein
LKASERLATLGIGAAWILGIRAALLVLGGLLGSSPLPEVVLGALIVDVAAGRAGLGWSQRVLERAAILRRVAAGAAAGAGAALVPLVVALSAGWATARAPTSSGVALLGLVGSTALAVRDEILYRGLPLMFAARAKVPQRFAIGFAALVSPSAFLLSGGATAEGVLLAIANGWLFATLYVRLDGTWAAVAAHAGWTGVTDVVFRGAVVDTIWSAGEIGEGEAARGAPAWVAAFVSAALAAALTRRLRPAGSERAPSRTRPSSS